MSEPPHGSKLSGEFYPHSVTVKKWPAQIIAAIIAVLGTATISAIMYACADRQRVIDSVAAAQAKAETATAGVNRLTDAIERQNEWNELTYRELKAIRIALASKGVKVEVEQP